MSKKSEKKPSKKKSPSISPASSKKKVKAVAIDGLGSVELMKMRNALRQVWQRSKQWRMVKARCKNDQGYFVCEECNTQVPKISVDHTIPIGDMLEPGFLERLMVPSTGLKGLCDTCHKPKTKKDNSETRAKKKIRESIKVIADDTLAVDEILILDPDIAEMDLYTYEKIALQKKRNEQAPKFRLEDFI